MHESDEKHWLTEQMQELRQRRERTAPSFAHTWRAAKARSSSAGGVARRRGFALASLALAVAVSAGYWSFARAQQNRRLERDYAALDGALLTYWQAPSDGWFALAPADDPTPP